MQQVPEPLSPPLTAELVFSLHEPVSPIPAATGLLCMDVLCKHHDSPNCPCPAGFFPTLLEDVPDMAVKFAAYESMRQLHKKLNDGRSASPQVRVQFAGGVRDITCKCVRVCVVSGSLG